jgi:hypothetical protein
MLAWVLLVFVLLGVDYGDVDRTTGGGDGDVRTMEDGSPPPPPHP